MSGTIEYDVRLDGHRGVKLKRINMLLVVLLLALTVVGVWGICRVTQGQMNVNIKLPPSAPALSAESGFYEESFELTITAQKGVNIYYTLDGSIPALDSVLYEEPIVISAGGGRENPTTYVPNTTADWGYDGGESHPNVATVLRAAAIDDSGLSSEIVTATYFVGETEFEENTIISIVADPDDLFGDNGIYVTGEEYDSWYLGGHEGPAPIPNFLKHGRDWERPAVIEFFQDTESFLQQAVGIRIQGASARDENNKRFSVYARKEYSGSSWFGVPLFGGIRSHAIVLRSGFMNGYIQHLVQDRDVASAESGEVVVYLNGALWYITIAQDKYTEKYFQEHYGVKDDNVVIVKGAWAVSKDAEEQALYQAMYDFLDTHDMSRDESYDQLNQIMDIQSYIDYSCVNVYFANLDYSEYKNTICWRAKRQTDGEYGDGRWRWALYDLDLENLNYGFKMEDINTFTLDTHYAGSAFNTRPMYVALKQNAVFCRQFVISFMDMVNTVFTAENAAAAMDSWTITLPWWGMRDDWVETFFPARTKAITGYLAEEFELTGIQEKVTLSVSDEEAGYIILNTITPELADGSWSGSYFTDYPITVTAVANSGHQFIGWQSCEIDLEQPHLKTMTVEIPEGGLTLAAVFE